MIHASKTVPFYVLIFLCLFCLLLSLSIILPGCSGDDDDDNNDDDNDDATAEGIAGTWNVILTIQIDTCYGLSTGDTIEDRWIITQNESSVSITDGEGDTYSGTYQNHTLAASYEGTQSDGECILDVEILVSGTADNEEMVMNGTLTALVQALTPDQCGFASCATASIFVATRI